MRKTAALLSFLLILSACAASPPPRSYDITFEDRPKITLDVAQVLVEQSYLPPGQAPNVDHLFPVRPVDAALRWGGERLLVGGSRRTAHFVVRNAAAVGTALETASGFTGLFTVDQAARYDLSLAVELRILDGGRSLASAEATANRSITVPENATEAERRAIWHRLTEDTMRDLDREIERVLPQYLSAYILPGG